MTDRAPGDPQREPDVYGALAPRLHDEEQRGVLRALLDRLAEGGGAAVRNEVQARVRAIVAEGD